jgi:purine-binding chemotaxis protein CheW
MSERQTSAALADDQSGQYLSFHLAGDDYAVDILRVQEIRGWENVRALPETADHIKGVLDLRGTIVPIIDLRIRFGQSEPAYTPTTVVIVTSVSGPEGRSHLVGAVVDGVSDVLNIDAADIKPPPEYGSAVGRRYLKGMVSRERGMVILLDLDRLFDASELGQLTEGPSDV